MPADIISIGQWLIDSFVRLWTGLGNMKWLGFAVIMFPILRKLVSLAKRLMNI